MMPHVMFSFLFVSQHIKGAGGKVKNLGFGRGVTDSCLDCGGEGRDKVQINHGCVDC